MRRVRGYRGLLAALGIAAGTLSGCATAINQADCYPHIYLDARYAIVKKVGEGGMSFVYLAHDVSTNERYAIKILSPALGCASVCWAPPVACG